MMELRSSKPLGFRGLALIAAAVGAVAVGAFAISARSSTARCFTFSRDACKTSAISARGKPLTTINGLIY